MAGRREEERSEVLEVFRIVVGAYHRSSIADEGETRPAWCGDHDGHEISSNLYSPAERNIRAIQDFPTPTTTKAFEGFDGTPEVENIVEFPVSINALSSPAYSV
ncbi:hypothetical protein TELCIR_02190 [Teladorsagia circumcincta]|uniref:Uncharacterized protein n=1 Tax=Teladorsagia circumcincta TaxID=45464 RepID=A0A2G9UZU5_TELCI|nr:hypothetical protein TELCIR_02190 [Teladorsagia circumcincta]